MNAQGGIATAVSYKDYGITLTVTPTIQNGKMVGMLLNVTITDVDTSGPPAGTAGVAFVTRTKKLRIFKA